MVIIVVFKRDEGREPVPLDLPKQEGSNRGKRGRIEDKDSTGTGGYNNNHREGIKTQSARLDSANPHVQSLFTMAAVPE